MEINLNSWVRVGRVGLKLVDRSSITQADIGVKYPVSYFEIGGIFFSLSALRRLIYPNSPPLQYALLRL